MTGIKIPIAVENGKQFCTICGEYLTHGHDENCIASKLWPRDYQSREYVGFGVPWNLKKPELMLNVARLGMLAVPHGTYVGPKDADVRERLIRVCIKEVLKTYQTKLQKLKNQKSLLGRRPYAKIKKIEDALANFDEFAKVLQKPKNFKELLMEIMQCIRILAID